MQVELRRSTGSAGRAALYITWNCELEERMRSVSSCRETGFTKVKIYTHLTLIPVTYNWPCVTSITPVIETTDERQLRTGERQLRKLLYVMSRNYRFYRNRNFCNWSSTLAFKTTAVEDTHLTLAVYPFQVGLNNSLIFLSLQTYVQSIIPWLCKELKIIQKQKLQQRNLS